MIVERFKVSHMEYFKNNESSVLKNISAQEAQALERSPYSYAIFTDSGEMAVICGVMEYWTGRAEAWVLFNAEVAKKHMVALHRIVQRFLKHQPVRRIEAAVSTDMDSFAARWVVRLGFILEARRLRSYLPNGNDVSLYSRVA